MVDVGLFTSRLDWRHTCGIRICGALVTSSLLPFFTAEELFCVVQTISKAHAEAALREVRRSGRPERCILCVSTRMVLLLSAEFKVLCREALPFDATFAHVHFSPELSTAVVATKFERSHKHVWAITVLRRQRSQRFIIQISPLNVEPLDEMMSLHGRLLGMTLTSDKQ